MLSVALDRYSERIRKALWFAPQPKTHSKMIEFRKIMILLKVVGGQDNHLLQSHKGD